MSSKIALWVLRGWRKAGCEKCPVYLSGTLRDREKVCPVCGGEKLGGK